jgi:hypothetical protein
MKKPFKASSALLLEHLLSVLQAFRAVATLPCSKSIEGLLGYGAIPT